MYAGALLILPSATLSNAQEAPTGQPREQAPAESVYTVTAGDTLWTLSAKFYGAPERWRELWRLNPWLCDPNRLYPGERLRLRGAPEGDDAALRELRRTVRELEFDLAAARETGAAEEIAERLERSRLALEEGCEAARRERRQGGAN